ncbi:hypothetical protein CEXT_568641 [Caerostris extrusa]|uniref:Uncharacterized protein n=1 Tax=Caerostris extrusa TaxID=172846 RepID=A0AAV4YBZ7_CAEEX|nr:hypothetical protein CEXT_568641 [Caerostris extrusa]
MLFATNRREEEGVERGKRALWRRAEVTPQQTQQQITEIIDCSLLVATFLFSPPVAMVNHVTPASHPRKKVGRLPASPIGRPPRDHLSAAVCVGACVLRCGPRKRAFRVYSCRPLATRDVFL